MLLACLAPRCRRAQQTRPAIGRAHGTRSVLDSGTLPVIGARATTPEIHLDFEMRLRRTIGGT